MVLSKCGSAEEGRVLDLLRRSPAVGAFNPEDMAVLVAAFDEAWEHLGKSGARLESERRIEEARILLAKFIIQEALKGERDVLRLREDALLQYAQAILRR